jgi:hypothetical protein
MKQAIAVERVHNPSQEEFERDYVARGRPVVLTGALDSWRGPSVWTPEYFRSKVGSRRVPIEVRRQGHMNQGERFEELTISEYFDRMEAGQREYFLSDQRLERVLPELSPDIPPPSLVHHSEAFLFIGRNSFAAMHYHSDDQAMLCQVVGHKRVVLYAPEDFYRLYPESWFSPRFNWSRIDFSQPERVDPEAFPLLKDAQPHECTLAPGEALFIPLHWWHATYGYELSFSVSFFWLARREEWRYPSPGLRTFAASKLVKYVYLPASRVKVLESLYYSFRKLRAP